MILLILGSMVFCFIGVWLIRDYVNQCVEKHVRNKLGGQHKQIDASDIAEQAAAQAASMVFDRLDKNCRCHKCKGVVRPGIKFCNHCGERFAIEKTHSILVDARILSVTDRTIVWECLSCNEKFEIPHPKTYPAIIRLECNNCDDLVADLVVRSLKNLELCELGTVSLEKLWTYGDGKNMDIGLSSDVRTV